jgi:hypothetical protein
MKCAMCGRKIKGRDYIHVSTLDQKDINVHSMPCEWYDFEGKEGNAV